MRWSCRQHIDTNCPWNVFEAAGINRSTGGEIRSLAAQTEVGLCVDAGTSLYTRGLVWPFVKQ